jgi:hypothetical protein
MRSNVAPLLGTTGTPEHDLPRLDGVRLVGLAFRESTLNGRTYLEAYGIDRDGDIVALAPRRPCRGTPTERAVLFASLLARGLRANGPILVDAAGCSLLQRRIQAAWGLRALLLDGRTGRS